MKTLIIFIALFGFHITSASGETIEVKVNVNKMDVVTCTDCPELIPVIPMVASYEDQKEVKTLLDMESLSPEIPLNADFNDEPVDICAENIELAPKVPLEADFQATL